jgi:hypothetical protein
MIETRTQEFMMISVLTAKFLYRMNQEGSKLNTFASNPIWNHKDSFFRTIPKFLTRTSLSIATIKNADEPIEHMINNTVKEYEASGKVGLSNYSTFKL